LNANAGNAVRIIPLSPEHAVSCEVIGRSLPAWFGIDEGLSDLRRCAEEEPGLVATIDSQVAGFLTLAHPFPETWEITWMAVAPDHHRQGVGRSLIEAIIADARAANVSLLHVKTLADSHPSPEYAGTRAFYRALGFERLIVLPELWGLENPCLLMVRAI